MFRVRRLVKIQTEIGISMKKPNFAFLENWMNEKKLRLLLKSVDITGDPQDSLIKELVKEEFFLGTAHTIVHKMQLTFN